MKTCGQSEPCVSELQDREISGTLFEAKALAEHWRQSFGAIREMTGKFGYRCVVLRDCATAREARGKK